MKLEKVVLAGASLIFLWYLGAHDLWAPDEPFFGEGAREMLVDGQWLVSHVNGVVNSHKPPLFFWLIALFSIPVGSITEFTARLPSVLAALGTLWLTMRLGRNWYGSKTAVLSGIILSTSFMFWEKARWAQIDSLLCFLIWVALSVFVSFRSGGMPGRKAGIVFWLACGLAVLAKGPVGLLLPLGIVLITLFFDKDLKSWVRFAPMLGPLTFVGVAGAWVAAVTLWGPADYSVVGALREHFVERGIHGMHHAQPFWYYFERLPSSILPWSGLLPGAIYFAWRRRAIKSDRVAIVSCMFVFIFFSISTEKRDLYMLPAFPAWALLIANLVGRLCQWGAVETEMVDPDKRWVTFGHGFTTVILLLVGMALPVVGRQFDEIPYRVICGVAVILLALSSVSLVTLIRGKITASVYAMAIGLSVGYLYTPAFVYPTLESTKSARGFAVRIKEVTAESRASGNRVLAWRLGNLPNAFAYYSDGMYTLENFDPNDLVQHMAQPNTVYAVVLANDLDGALLKQLEKSWVVDETRLSRRDVLLISNKQHKEGRSITDVDFSRYGRGPD